VGERAVSPSLQETNRKNDYLRTVVAIRRLSEETVRGGIRMDKKGGGGLPHIEEACLQERRIWESWPLSFKVMIIGGKMESGASRDPPGRLRA